MRSSCLKYKKTDLTDLFLEAHWMRGKRVGEAELLAIDEG